MRSATRRLSSTRTNSTRAGQLSLAPGAMTNDMRFSFTGSSIAYGFLPAHAVTNNDSSTKITICAWVFIGRLR